ncbi:MAG: hypothetical protein RSA99_01485 [Oscillospiraceae bacterium]
MNNEDKKLQEITKLTKQRKKAMAQKISKEQYCTNCKIEVLRNGYCTKCKLDITKHKATKQWIRPLKCIGEGLIESEQIK